DLWLNADGKAEMTLNGEQIGNSLTDNRYEYDGYRFHDVFHLTYAAMLGWSPMIRRLLGLKRRSDTDVDEIEDGARAGITEEAIAAMAFSHAEQQNYFKGVAGVRFELLRTIKLLTGHLEVSARSEGEWERAILRGFELWNEINASKGGRLHLDLRA